MAKPKDIRELIETCVNEHGEFDKELAQRRAEKYISLTEERLGTTRDEDVGIALKEALAHAYIQFAEAKSDELETRLRRYELIREGYPPIYYDTQIKEWTIVGIKETFPRIKDAVIHSDKENYER